MTLGNKLKQIRNLNNMTQDELAKALNISKGTIGMYEINKRKPDTDMLKKIADFFNISLDYLLGRTDNPNYAVISKDELPQELLEVGYDYLVVLKEAKETGLTADELHDLIELAKKMKK